MTLRSFSVEKIFKQSLHENVLIPTDRDVLWEQKRWEVLACIWEAKKYHLRWLLKDEQRSGAWEREV